MQRLLKKMVVLGATLTVMASIGAGCELQPETQAGERCFWDAQYRYRCPEYPDFKPAS